jgi:hypothetical protein
VDEGTLNLNAAVPPNIEHMRCAAHTLQLAVLDGIKNSRAETVIAKVRKVVKEGRTSKINEIIKKRTKKILPTEQETRWGSIYLMVNRLVELRSTIQEIADCGNQVLAMTDAQWRQATELRDLLLKAYEVTKKLQYADITPGYFYRKWSGLRLYYENNGSILATEIAKSMKKRESELLNNGLLLAAVYLDVHNMDLLPEDSVEKAKESVAYLVLRLQGLEADDVNNTVDEGEMSSDSEDEFTDSDSEVLNLRKRKHTSTSSSSDEGLPDISSLAGSPVFNSPEVVDSPDVDSPDVNSPDVDTPDVDSPDVDAPDVDSPDFNFEAADTRDQLLYLYECFLTFFLFIRSLFNFFVVLKIFFSHHFSMASVT